MDTNEDEIIDNLYRSIDDEAMKLAEAKKSCREAEILLCLKKVNEDLASYVTKALDEALVQLEMEELEKVLNALKSSKL